jgi:hypothetical protein
MNKLQNMHISQALTEKIAQTITDEVSKGKRSGVIEGYNLSYYLDQKPAIKIVEFPLNILIPNRAEIVYIGGQLES